MSVYHNHTARKVLYPALKGSHGLQIARDNFVDRHSLGTKSPHKWPREYILLFATNHHLDVVTDEGLRSARGTVRMRDLPKGTVVTSSGDFVAPAREVVEAKEEVAELKAKVEAVASATPEPKATPRPTREGIVLTERGRREGEGAAAEAEMDLYEVFAGGSAAARKSYEEAKTAKPEPVASPSGGTPVVKLAGTLKGYRAEFKAKEMAEVRSTITQRIRKAITSGDLMWEFSVRSLVAWEIAYMALRTEGLTEEEAFDYSFAVVGMWPFVEDEREFIIETHYAATGRATLRGAGAGLKKLLKNRLRHYEKMLKEVCHPALPLVVALARFGLNVWPYGGAGAGKSVMVEQVSRILGRSHHRAQGSKESTIYDLLGKDILSLRDGVTVSAWQDGIFPTAMADGGIVVLDEVSKYRDAVLSELHAVLERGKPLVLKQDGGRVVQPQGGYCVIAPDNTCGAGEGVGYVGTEPVNLAFRNRFCFIEVSSMDAATERRAIKHSVDAALDGMAEHLTAGL